MTAGTDPPLGRREAVAELRALLRGERLVALLGPPGAGKSHLARFVADAHDGSVTCDLSSVLDADTAMSGVAAALGARLSLDESVDEAMDQLGTILAERGDALLVLDHGERVESIAPAIATWLRAAPKLKVLWVARQRLGLDLERPYDLPPLSLAATAGPSDAAQLFAARAAAVRPGFTLEDPATKDVVEQLVRRLDGLPLAIELAASRMRILGPAQILSQIEKRSGTAMKSVLADGPDRALESALDASWETLSAAERSALSQCAVFSSGFAPEAALTVIDLSMHEGAPSVLDVLTSLRDRSLLHVGASPEMPGELRFHLLNAVRDYAQKALDAENLQSGAESRHADYYLLAAEEWIRGGSVDGVHARARLSLEMDNLRAVLDRALAVSPPDVSSGTTALRAALAMEAVLWVRGPMSALLTALDSALRVGAPGGADPTLVARARRARWDALQSVARSREVLTDFTAAQGAAADADDPELAALLAEAKSRHSMLRGRLTEAQTGLEEALELHRRRGDDAGLARTLHMLADVALSSCDLAAAERYCDEAAVHADRAADLRLQALVMAMRAEVVYERGDRPGGEAGFADAEAAHRRASDPHGQAIVEKTMGLSAFERGDHRAAITLLDDALALAREVGNRHEEGAIRSARGLVRLGEDALEEARDDLKTARDLLHQAGDARGEMLTGCALVELAARRGELDAARSRLTQLRALVASAEGPVPACLATLAGARLAALEAAQSIDSDPEGAARHLDAARARMEEAPELPSFETRAIRRFVERALSDPRFPAASPVADDSGVLLIGDDGRWFRPPGGEVVDIATRGPLRRIVAALAESRAEASETGLTVEELLERGWPGERVIPEAAKNRVYVAVANLRKLGLKDVLLRRDDGYLLDPDVPIRVKHVS